MRRPLPLLLPGLLAFALLTAASIITAPPASAATIAATTTCSNGVDNTPGLGLICQVTIVNTITPSGGSATVTVRECHGAAGDPEAACSTTTSVLTEPVTNVTQCNASTNGGGGTLRCRVRVTNNFVGIVGAPTAATVNQCNGSGFSPSGDITTGCDPFPANKIGATITQCNGSANGETLVGLTCTATGTQSEAFGVTINQCNGSTNGGGALVICSANITNNDVPASPSPAPSADSTTGSASPASSADSASPAPTADSTTSSPAPTADSTTSSPAPTVTVPNTGVTFGADSGSAGAALGLVLLVLLSLLTVGTRLARSDTSTSRPR